MEMHFVFRLLQLMKVILSFIFLTVSSCHSLSMLFYSTDGFSHRKRFVQQNVTVDFFHGNLTLLTYCGSCLVAIQEYDDRNCFTMQLRENRASQPL